MQYFLLHLYLVNGSCQNVREQIDDYLANRVHAGTNTYVTQGCAMCIGPRAVVLQLLEARALAVERVFADFALSL